MKLTRTMEVEVDLPEAPEGWEWRLLQDQQVQVGLVCGDASVACITGSEAPISLLIHGASEYAPTPPKFRSHREAAEYLFAALPRAGASPAGGPMEGSMTYHEREAAYRAADGLNQSRLKPLRKSPLHAWHEANSERKTSPAMAVGTLTERLLVVPDDVRADEVMEGFTPAAKVKALEAARGAAAAVRASAKAKAMRSGCEYGIPCYWEVGGQRRKALFDAVDTVRHRIVDLKTTSVDMTRGSLQRQVATYDYAIQAAWYMQGYAATHGVVPEFWFLFVESSAPHAVVPVRLKQSWIDKATEEMETMAAVWQQCADAGVWPGPAEMADDPLELSEPTWLPTYTVGE